MTTLLSARPTATPQTAAKAPMPVRHAALSTGVTLPYVEQGSPTGVPVLMLHGITDSWHSFEPVLPHLPARVRALALTQRGHADADQSPDGYRTRDFAADAAAFIEALGLGPVVLVGHSMGTTNALRLAIDRPDLVRGLVLAGAFASYANNPGLVDYCDTCISTLVDPIAPSVALEFQESTLARPIAPQFLDLVVRESLKVPARVWRAAFAGLLEDDFAAELEKVGVPTLCVWGDRDAFVPRADQHRLLASIRGARLQVYEGAGHALHWEEPARFASDVAAFVRQVSA